MLQYRIRLLILTLLTLLSASLTASADTWRLGQGPDFRPVSDSNDPFLMAASRIEQFVYKGQTQAVQDGFEKLKKDFPEITGPDLDIFIEAEILLSQGKFTKAYRSYDKLLIQHPYSELREAVTDRQFAIGTAYLGGQKKRILSLFNIKGYAEGVRIMERIVDRAPDSAIATDAIIAVAENYEQRQKYEEAYYKWEELSIQGQTGQFAKKAMLSMARCMHAIYNKHPENKRPFYDASNLETAKTLYEEFKKVYPNDANDFGIDEIISQIIEQLAQKQLSIAQYYQRTSGTQKASDESGIDPAKLYFNMVIESFPDSKAAKTANKILNKNTDSKETKNEERKS